MLITNHTRFCLGVNSKEFLGYIQPESTLEIPEDAARHWLDKPTPAALRARGLLSVSGETTTAPETTTARRPHWRKAVAAIDKMTDLDKLLDLHTHEDRPRVLTAIEARMESLNGETFAGE